MEPLTAVSVEPPPPLPQLHLVAEGRPFQLSCLAPEGRPPAAVWWETPAGVVLNKPRKVRGTGGAGRSGDGGLSLPLGLPLARKLSLFSLSWTFGYHKGSGSPWEYL